VPRPGIEQILQSLWEAFLVLDPQGHCSDFYSRSMETLLAGSPKGRHFTEILAVPEKDVAGLREWYRFLFTFNAPFEEIAGLGPTELNTVDPSKRIALAFRPVFDSTQTLQSVILIAQDVTIEHEIQLRNERLRMDSEMILQRYRHAAAFERSLELIHECIAHLRDAPQPLAASSAENLRRELHTLMGILGIFAMSDLTTAIRTIEDNLAQLANPIPPRLLSEQADILQQALQKFFASYSETLGLEKRRHQGRRIIAFQRIERFQTHLLDIASSAETLSLFKELFCKVQLSEFLLPLKLLAEKQALRLNKNIAVQLECPEDLMVDPAFIESFIDQLTRVIDFTVLHGIEERRERLAAQKPEEATLHIGARQIEQHLEVTIKDDGRGLNALTLHSPTQHLGIDALLRWVEHHQGALHIDGQLGLGSSFTFTLPLAAHRSKDAA
jgi:HPt (histidine-containing phosphotransfer) domain-containing protein